MRRALFTFLLAVTLAVTPTPAHADRDVVQFGNNINATAGNPIADAVCFFCSVHVDGEVKGDIVVFFGNVHVAGNAHHDVVNFFGNITAADNSSISGDMVSIFSSIRLGEHVTVSKDLVVVFGSLHAPESASVGGDRVVQPAWIALVPLAVLMLIIILIVEQVHAYRRRQLLRVHPYQTRQ
ncbi:MAG TPA: hypothetical protein VGT08_21140 [Terracidiphilus sp.]|nr:hypothetical protein [Terracidiphilus sp.]